MSTKITYTKVVLDFEHKQGDTFRKKIEFKTKTNNVESPDDITTSTFRLQIATDVKGENVVKTLTLGSGLSVESTNILVITLTAAETAALNGLYYYDVQRTYADTTVVTRPEGRMEFKSDVTHG
jgi:hypothetical protein